MHYDLPISTKAIARIIRQEGLVRKKKKKWKKQQDLREKKKVLKALEFIEFDTKDLSDIEKYWPQMKKLGLPRYEHTARDIRTGGTWFAYARTNDTTNAAIFATLVLKQLESYGVDMNEVIIQTDNGSEYIGSVSKRKGESAFEKVLKEFKVKWSRIPPGAKTWQSDVEAFHKIIEDEFYDIEDYKGSEEFKAKAYAYALYFNFKRKNRYKGCKTPTEILEEIKHNSKNIISPQVFNFPPVILDDFFEIFIDERMKGGYHVGSSAEIDLKFP
jgi:transposase InsO family protein